MLIIKNPLCNVHVGGSLDIIPTVIKQMDATESNKNPMKNIALVTSTAPYKANAVPIHEILLVIV